MNLWSQQKELYSLEPRLQIDVCPKSKPKMHFQTVKNSFFWIYLSQPKRFTAILVVATCCFWTFWIEKKTLSIDQKKNLCIVKDNNCYPVCEKSDKLGSRSFFLYKGLSSELRLLFRFQICEWLEKNSMDHLQEIEFIVNIAILCTILIWNREISYFVSFDFVNSGIYWNRRQNICAYWVNIYFNMNAMRILGSHDSHPCQGGFFFHTSIAV